jgi:prevent-host-death family protein
MTTSTRRLREKLAQTLSRAARGEEVIVTRRGKPYVRLLPVADQTGGSQRDRYPLRGTLRSMADDFDAPLPGLWRALRK